MFNLSSQTRMLLSLSSYPIFWFVGAVPLWGLVVLMLMYRGKTIPPINFMFAFGVVQIASVCISMFSDWFQGERLAPIIHNIIVYFIFVFSFAFMAMESIDYQKVAKVLKLFIVVNFLICSLVYVASGGGEISYRGLVNSVSFSRVGYIFDDAGTRVSFLGFYVNSAAMLYCFMFFLFCALDSEESKLVYVLLYLFSLASVVMSGSRVVVVTMMLLPFIVFMRMALIRYIAILIVPLLLWGSFEYGMFDVIYESRQGSSDTRTFIYESSLTLMFDNNYFTGLGIKPYLPIIDFPIGSHSTYVGYLVKNGMLGGAFLILFFIFLVKNFIFSMSVVSSFKNYYVWVLILLGCFIFAFEDLDAFEFNAFLFGLLLGFGYKINQYDLKG